MDFETRDLFQLINMVGTLTIGVWLYLEKRNDKTNARIDATDASIETMKDDVGEQLAEHGKQLAHLEAKAEGAPTHSDLGELHDRVNDALKAINTLSGEFSGVKAVLQLIHEHLLRGTK